MPLIELKTIKPVCDICGKVGSTWTNVDAGDEGKAIPPGWKQHFQMVPPHQMAPHRPMEGAQRFLVCDECQPDPRIQPENDSRA